jgi:transposase-like protein
MKDRFEGFDSEEECIDYLYVYKWPDGFFCAKCSHDQAYKISTRRLPLYECTRCHHQTSLLKGTVMEGSRTELTKWFSAIRLVAEAAFRITALSLAESIGVTYKTAWLMLHKIRRAIGQRHGIYELIGVIDLDEAKQDFPTEVIHNYQESHNLQENHQDEGNLKRGRKLGKIAIGLRFCPEAGNNPLYVRMQIIPNLVGITPAEFAYRSMTLGGLQSSQPAEGTFEVNTDPLKWLQAMVSKAKSFVGGAFHGRIRKHLQSYLDEFCYSYNRGKNHMRLFERLLLTCAYCPTVTYTQLIMPNR